MVRDDNKTIKFALKSISSKPFDDLLPCYVVGLAIGSNTSHKARLTLYIQVAAHEAASYLVLV